MSWATVNAATGVTSPLGTTGFTAATTANNAGWAAGANTDINATSGTLSVASGSTVNSVRFSGGAAQGYNLFLVSGANTITSGGILSVPTAGYLVPMSISGAGTLKSGGTNDLVVNNYNPYSPFTISASIVNGSNGVTVGGTGTTILSGTNSYTGPTYVSGGTLLATTTGALPGFSSANAVFVPQGTLAVSAGGTGWTSANIDSVLANATFGAGTALGIDVSSTVGSFTYGSNVSGARGLTAMDAGTLVLTGTSSYTGPTTITGGSTVSVATVAAAGSASPLGAGPNIIIGGGTLQFTGAAGTILSRPVSLTEGGGSFNVTNSLTLSGAVSGAAGLTLTGGTLTLSGTNTYSGPTVVSAGQLNVNSATALPAGSDVVLTTAGTLQFANGIVPTVGSLNGSGTVNLGNATSLTVGNDLASGTFQGVVANGSGGALTLVKNGAGTQVLSGNNTYTGGTTINTGTLQISPQIAATNPLGTSTVTLAGSGGANQATLAFRSQLPIGVTGFNQDVVWTGSEGSVAANAVSRGLDPNSVFYTTDVAPGSLPNVPGGLPLSRALSATNLSGLTAGTIAPGSSYVLQPYTANNALQLGAQATGTLSLLTPGKFASINVLANSANGASTMSATLHFSDSSTDTISLGSVSDWFGGTPFYVGGMGRYNVATGVFDGTATVAGTANPRLYEIALPLSAADQLKTLTSITFQNTAVAGVANTIDIFALNGVARGRRPP